MTEILDDIQPKELKPSGYIFTLISVIYTIITTSILYYHLFLETNESDQVVTSLTLLSYPLIPFVGLIITYFGFVRKERLETIRWVAGSVNLLMFLFILASYIFAHLAFSGS